MHARTILPSLLLISLAFAATSPAQPARPPFTKADFERAMKELSNWDFLLTTSPLARRDRVRPQSDRDVLSVTYCEPENADDLA